MSKNKRKQPNPSSQPKPARKSGKQTGINVWPWILGVCALTAIAFFPMLSNGFTNWDDQFYITENAFLRGPDWASIFSKPLMANYHPLTVATLALNYQLSELQPFSYHLVNWLVHIVNTGLVFYFAYKLSDNKPWVGLITAMLFGIHPMHVESVAWASERKDVLFTLFFLLSLIYYLKYIRLVDWKNYTITLVLFFLSLVSKPAAVSLPLVLLLMDWYRGRSFTEAKVWLEKIPFFILSLIFGLMTIRFQDASKAFAESELYPFWQKVIFSFYGFGEYIRRIVWPFPLSSIHPFPDSATIPVSYYFMILIGIVTVALAWYFREKKYILFGVAFFAANIVLVLQLLTFGHAIIAERYTYVPYIGLFFAIGMMWEMSTMPDNLKKGILGVILLAGLGFSFATFQQVKVWKDAEALWTNAIRTYPDAYMPRSNRGQFLAAKKGKYEEALVDYAIALKAQPNDSFSLLNRATIYINQQNFPAALADADSLVKTAPGIAKGHLFRAISLNALGNTEEALVSYNNCIRIDSFVEEAWSNRGILKYNKLQDYAGAKEDFDYAIRVDPSKGLNYKNRARCWIKFGRKAEALKDLETAKQLGTEVNADLMQSAQALQ